MNNKLLNLIIIIVVSALLSACGGAGDDSSDTMESIEKISKAIESGKSMRCDVAVKDEASASAMKAVYWVKGEKMRIESDYNGVSQAVIQKDKTVFMNAKDMQQNVSSCDWLTLEASEEEASEETMDYEEFENDPNYSIKCTQESFGDDKFATPGEVCSMNDLMNSMMKGLDLEGMDLGDIDMGDYGL